VLGAVAKAHGSSNETAFMNAIRQGRQMAASDVVSKIRQGLEKLMPKPAVE